MKVYTRTGDDGTTGLFYGGRAPKDSDRPWAYGTVDEAQSAIGLARAHCERGGEADRVLVGLCHDLYVAMAELATLPENRRKLVAGTTLVTAEMVTALEGLIDAFSERFEMPKEFVIPGQTVVAAHLDHARTVVRRAERLAMRVAGDGSHVVPYLNRLSDLLWTLARWAEGGSLAARATSGPTDATTSGPGDGG
jgi:cob(I)alamin adenosyltransferase